MLVFDVLEAEYDEYDVVNKAVSSVSQTPP